jgi:heparin binding hemagglutinin HbhA
MMSDMNQNQDKSQNENIGDQLNELGKNLLAALQTAWESEERKKVQKEIEDGLANLGASLSQAAQEFSSSATGQSLKEDVKDIRDRWQSGEVGSKVRTEVSEALRKVNEELQKASGKNSPPPSGGSNA